MKYRCCDANQVERVIVSVRKEMAPPIILPVSSEHMQIEQNRFIALFNLNGL